MAVQVECYSGQTYAEEPRTFVWREKCRAVTLIRKRWREPRGPCFEVLADDAQVYQLAYNELTCRWSVSRRKVPRVLSDTERHERISGGDQR